MLQTHSKVSKKYRNKQIVKSYESLIKKPEAMPTAVIDKVAQDFSLSPRTVYNVLNQVK